MPQIGVIFLGGDHLSKKLLLPVVILVIVMGFVCLEIFISTHWLKVTHYDISSEKIQNKMTICLLADLHDHEFGEGNAKLVEKVMEENPDLIIMCGDFLNADSADASVPVTLLPQLTAIAPVYFTWGNQEMDYMKAHQDLPEQLENAGAIILEEDMADLEINGNRICLAGMYDYAFALEGHGSLDKTQMDPKLLDFLETYQRKDTFKLMSAHRPDSFVFGQAVETWDIDLVLSGHIHGGQVILPFVGGLYGADLGFFPEYDFGEYHFPAVKNMIITTGLGSDKEKLPRFNKVPEIVMIDFKPAE